MERQGIGIRQWMEAAAILFKISFHPFKSGGFSEDDSLLIALSVLGSYHRHFGDAPAKQKP